MIVIYDKEKQRVPIKAWVNSIDDIEEGTLQQALNLSNLPFVFRHVALLPDCHQGYGMPIGGVIACKNVVIPYAVGSDIGCGVCSVNTGIDVNEISREVINKIVANIRQTIPMGFKKHKKISVEKSRLLSKVPFYQESCPIIEREFNNMELSLGTMGGSNHFISLQKNTFNQLCIMIHSGSRNVGLQVAKYYNDKAKELNEKYFSSVSKEWNLAFLPMDSYAGIGYWGEMLCCVKFAELNRYTMMKEVLQIIREQCIQNNICEDLNVELHLSNMINIHHNYAVLENHFGKNVIVHRKGATLARKDIIGLIPGSQATSSYVVSGKGNKESFMSCSHGAGRAMSRTKAVDSLNLEDEINKLNERGIINSIRNKSDLQEAGGAYKDIEKVMSNQEDLVSIIDQMTPIISIMHSEKLRHKKGE